jgi:hypothetical protein
MTRKSICLTAIASLLLSASLGHAQSRGKGEQKGRETGKPEAGKTGGKPPGGNWSEPKPPAGNQRKDPENYNSKSPNAEGAAAGAATANRSSPKATGAEGAAAANRNQPKATGAEGAAAGAAAANRNAPKASGAEGAAAGAAVANRNAPRATGAEGAAAGAAVARNNGTARVGAANYDEVRNSFDRHDLYEADWYGSHVGAWSAASWPASAAWSTPAWSGLAKHFGYGDSAPISYGFGSNVTCVNGNVLLNGENIGTAEEFSQQASELAKSGADAQASAEDKWVPLGVFAMVRNEQQHPQLILQLAMNQRGNLRGNYTDETTDNTMPIQGGIDVKTQRVAWTVGSNSTTVMEAGLSNLTESEATALLHKAGKTEPWILVRLQQPK